MISQIRCLVNGSTTDGATPTAVRQHGRARHGPRWSNGRGQRRYSCQHARRLCGRRSDYRDARRRCADRGARGHGGHVCGGTDPIRRKSCGVSGRRHAWRHRKRSGRRLRGRPRLPSGLGRNLHQGPRFAGRSVRRAQHSVRGRIWRDPSAHCGKRNPVPSAGVQGAASLRRPGQDAGHRRVHSRADRAGPARQGLHELPDHGQDGGVRSGYGSDAVLSSAVRLDLQEGLL